VDEVVEEAHLSKDWLEKGIGRFSSERDARLTRLRSALSFS